ncbi:hypothetical protein Tco_0520389 [Tanacetum coccineum]
MPITSAEDKAQRRLEVNARSTLMMGIPNEHRLKFNSIKEYPKALLLEAIKKRFGGNEASKKTQRNLLKQQYQNFTAPSSEMLYQTLIASKACLVGYDWSDQAASNEGTNICTHGYSTQVRLRGYPNDSKCLKSCMETWKKKLEFYKKNEYVYVENINGLKSDIQVKEMTIRELRKKLEKLQKEKDSIQFNVENFEEMQSESLKQAHSSVILFEKCKKVLSNKLVVENRKSDEDVSKVVGKNNDAPIIKEWVSDRNMFYLTDYEEIDGGYVAFGGNPKGGKIIRKGTQSLMVLTVQKASNNADQARKETEPVKDYIFLPLWTVDLPFSQDPKSSHNDGSKPSSDDGKKVDEDPRKDSKSNDQEKEDNVNNANNVNVASTNEVNGVGGKTSIELPDDPNMPALEDYSIFDFIRNDEDDGVVLSIPI